MSEIKVTKTLPEHSRKRVVQSNKHKRTISKQNRYSAKSLPKYPTCSHKEGTIKCRTLSMMDIKRFHELFYNNKDKVAQDTLIYKCCYALKAKKVTFGNKRKRSRTNARIYLSCTLNIRKLYKLYNTSAEDHLKIKESYFRKFVNRNYNLGFGTPKTDVCSVCLNFKEEIKKEKDETLTTNLITKQRVHKLKANAFFAMLKEEKDNVINYSFDCQKNLALPRLPDSSAYFTQQYNLYNFTIVKGDSDDEGNYDAVSSLQELVEAEKGVSDTESSDAIDMESWVIVTYSTKKTLKHFIGEVIEV
ncbi:hypothetical protein JTB14_028178 [Gonioctena quinquepunctata]|nr:hypothetical protein JTB14_028178 [Gonioctena quinquepunctata]